MTVDIIPDNRNRLAYLIGRIFHPYLICIPTLFAMLKDLTPAEAVRWTVLVISMVLGPGLVLATFLKYKGRYVYQRRTRTPLYIVGWLSVLACLGVLLLLDAPTVLVACLATLSLWVPLQLLVNTFITKLSAHAAVAAGCYTGLLMLGRLETPLIQLGLLILVLITVWARVTTKNHSFAQVLLGLLLGTIPVLIVFPLVLT